MCFDKRVRLSLLVAALASCSHATQDKPGPVPDTTKIHRGDKPLTLLGPTLEVGAQLPDFTVYDGTLQPVKLAQLHKPLVISVVPSIDTRVCESQTHHVDAMIDALPPGTEVYTVSRDLPFAQTRFTEEAHTRVKMASDYRDGSFGKLMGLEVGESGLLARSVWVVGSDGKIAYRQLVDDQGTEPELDPVIAAVKATK